MKPVFQCGKGVRHGCGRVLDRVLASQVRGASNWSVQQGVEVLDLLEET